MTKYDVISTKMEVFLHNHDQLIGMNFCVYTGDTIGAGGGDTGTIFH